MGLWDHIKPAAQEPTPVSIDRSPVELRIAWSDGLKTVATARELRLGCPCAACIEEWSGRRTVDAVQVPDDIAISSADGVGNYALAIAFSDKHATGIYAWKTLRLIGRPVADS